MPIKLGFVLSSSSDNPLPSTRIAVLNMFPFLKAADFDPSIVYSPDQPSMCPDLSGLAERVIADKFHIVCFQKVGGPSATALVRTLSAAGIKTVFIVCDGVDVEMAAATDATITVTNYLRSFFPEDLRSKVEVVHDGIEHPEHCKVKWTTHRGSRSQPLRAVLVTSSKPIRLPVIGNPPEWLEIAVVGSYVQAHTVRRLREFWWDINGESMLSHRIASVRALMNDRIRRIPWDPVGVYSAMQEADIGIIPIESSRDMAYGITCQAWRVKSENRLTLKMGIGLPVVATPIPSYEQVIVQGKNGFLADSRAEWLQCLEALRDPDLRRRMGEEARASVVDRYSLVEQARRLIALLHRLV